jgi:hypothetical protein
VNLALFEKTSGCRFKPCGDAEIGAVRFEQIESQLKALDVTGTLALAMDETAAACCRPRRTRKPSAHSPLY